MLINSNLKYTAIQKGKFHTNLLYDLHIILLFNSYFKMNTESQSHHSNLFA